MEILLAALKQCELFRDLPPDVIARDILPHGQVQEYPKGKHIMVPQDRADRFGVITAGRLHILHIFVDGTYSLATALETSDLLGADLICTKSRLSPYHVVAAAPSQAVFFPAGLLLAPGMMDEGYRLEALNRLLMFISHDSMKKEYRFAILSQKGLRERIITYLTMQANKRGTGTIIVPFSREEMASYLCVNRSALSHELGLMRKEGLISFRKNVFTLHDWKMPDRRAGGRLQHGGGAGRP